MVLSDWHLTISFLITMVSISGSRTWQSTGRGWCALPGSNLVDQGGGWNSWKISQKLWNSKQAIYQNMKLDFDRVLLFATASWVFRLPGRVLFQQTNCHFTCNFIMMTVWGRTCSILSVYVTLYLTAEKPNRNILDCSIFAKETWSQPEPLEILVWKCQKNW